MTALYDSVVDVISTRFEIEPERVLPEASFDDLDLDSLSQVELATVLGHKFGLEMSDEELARISRVSEVVGWLHDKGATV